MSEAEPNESTEKPVQSWAGALVALAKMFGPYAPWAIIAVLLFFGAYKFTEQQQEAQKAARVVFQNELNQAHADLLSTYQQIGTMHKQQLENIASMLTVHERTSASTAQLHEQAERERKALEDARAESARQTALADEARKIADSATKAASDQMSKATLSRKELAAKQNELDRKDQEVSQRAAKIGDLSQKLIELAKRVESITTDSQTIELARSILRQYSTDPKKLLIDFSRAPSITTATSLKNLIGLDAQTIETALREGLGFAFWNAYALRSSNETVHVGVSSQTPDTDEGIVAITISKTKLSNIKVLSLLSCVKTSDPRDWNQVVAYGLAQNREKAQEATIFRFQPKGDTWILLHTSSDELGAPTTTIFGQEKPLAFIEADQLQKRYPELYKIALDDKFSDFADAMAMAANATKFDANKIANGLPKEVSKELRQAFIGILSQAVKHEAPLNQLAKASTLRSPIFGKIAATALKPDFRVLGADTALGKSRDSSSQNSTGVLQQVSASIVCEYVSSSEGKNKARFTFVQEAQDVWTLADFEAPVAVSSTGIE